MWRSSMKIDEPFVRCFEAALRRQVLLMPSPLVGTWVSHRVNADINEICDCIAEASRNASLLRQYLQEEVASMDNSAILLRALHLACRVAVMERAERLAVETGTVPSEDVVGAAVDAMMEDAVEVAGGSPELLVGFDTDDTSVALTIQL